MDQTKEKLLNSIIGKTYKAGVILSMTITIAGLIKYFFIPDQNMLSFKDFVTDYSFNLGYFRQSLFNLESTAIMLLGVLLLMLTPVARILFSIVGFTIIKDRRYTFVGLVTLTIIALSIVVGLIFR